MKLFVANLNILPCESYLIKTDDVTKAMGLAIAHATKEHPHLTITDRNFDIVEVDDKPEDSIIHIFES